jgi:prepilin peptidase CpaA
MAENHGYQAISVSPTGDLMMLTVAGASIFLVAAALFDILSYRIPNRLCLALAVLSCLHILVIGESIENAALRTGIAFAVLIVGLILQGHGFVGGGDIKLIAAVSLWIYPADWPLFMLAIMLFGGFLALAILILRKLKAWIPEYVTTRNWLKKLLSDNEGIPYGVAVSSAGMMFLALELERLKLFG